MKHRSLMTLPVALLAATVIATPAWAGEDDDDPVATPAPTEAPIVAPTPAPPVPTVAPPVATPAPVVPVVRERDTKAPRKHTGRHHKATHKVTHTVVTRPVVFAAQVSSTPAGGVQAGEGGTAPEDGGLPLAGFVGGAFLLLLAGAAARAGVRR